MKTKNLEIWLAEHVLGWRWWRFHYTKKKGGDGSRWQELVPPSETWPQTHGRKWGGKLAKVKHPTLEDTTGDNFHPLSREDHAAAVLDECFVIFPIVHMRWSKTQFEIYTQGYDSRLNKLRPQRIQASACGKDRKEAICWFAYDLFRIFVK